MTAPIRQRVPLAASDERVIVRRSAARHDRATAAAGVLPPKPRHAGCGLIPLPRLSAHDHDDVTVVRPHGELDPSGTAVLHAQLRDIRWRARARSVADLTGLPVPGRASLSMPARRCKPIRDRAGNLAPGGPQAPAMRGALPVTGMLTCFEAHDSAGHAVTGTGPPSQPFFLRPSPAPDHHSRRNSAHRRCKSAIGAGLRERGSVRRRRHVQPRHAHGLIPGAYQRPVILPPCPTSGLRRGTLYRESR
jgi:hypothetical protein